MLKKFTGNSNISKKSRLPVGLKPTALTTTVGAVFIQSHIPLSHLDD